MVPALGRTGTISFLGTMEAAWNGSVKRRLAYKSEHEENAE